MSGADRAGPSRRGLPVGRARPQPPCQARVPMATGGRLTIERGLQPGREDALSAASLRATLWFLFRVALTAAAEGQAAAWRLT